MPDDMTPEEDAARALQPGPPRKASSEKTCKTAANKWWKMFLKDANWPESKINFLDEEGTPIPGTFRQFFVCLFEQHVHYD